MLEIIGFRLDDFHLLCELSDKDGSTGWWMVTVNDPIDENGAVICKTKNENGNFFEMVQIDKDKFEWEGKSVRLIKA